VEIIQCKFVAFLQADNASCRSSPGNLYTATKRTSSGSQRLAKNQKKQCVDHTEG
jgi:hypothetical protein